ncbi:ATP-dependent DNA helicase RecQ [Emticicia aquatilis]|uniref:DNA helicase RecQ n=1 Tax=Emticicia aquatilis TaxID=1537369 RepID=A0A917DRL0_9BACT|nr:DNA helicase RecQ [Emticicia aquatilis]GGD59964.1 ATP-dependent DNA helicase RecQ [Emticicia aquatilis]
MTKEQVLKKYFGYDKFRPLQADIIDTILAKQDCMVLMPTGGGKSICFQVPALVMEGITLVISPLIALMQDQVQSLKANGVPAAFMNSTLSMVELRTIEEQCKSGELKLLYISPEKLFSNNYLGFIKTLNVNQIAIDESHCVSNWGHDFRPEYIQLKVLKEAFPSVPMVALTATADKVTRKDILTQLGIPDAQIFISSFDRPNLSLAVLPGRNRLKIIHEFIAKRPYQSGIIYCLSRKNTEEVAEGLRKLGLRAMHYHAGVDAQTRSEVQVAFIKDEIQVIVATIAFGMGIDKSNVRFVIHYSLPSNVESYYQEIGRAGRDGMKSDTLLFYSFGDIITRKEMIQKSELPDEMKEVQFAKLDRMKQYAESEICRRRILLSYFNEEAQNDCGNCDVCHNPPKKFDATIFAQKALSAVARAEEKVAMGLLIDILRGAQNRAIYERGYQNLKTFGVGKELKYEEWADYITQLLNSGVIDIAYDERHALKLNSVSWQVLKGERKVDLVRFEAYDVKRARLDEEAPKEKSKKEVIKDALFEKLRILRKKIADEQNVPPFVIFSDATLSDMAQKRPINRFQMMAVSGVGEQKFRQYGDEFINEILSFTGQNPGIGRAKQEKGMTFLETFEMYKAGMSLEEMAAKRSLNPVTIVSHLVKLYQDGQDIDLKQYIATYEYNQIIAEAMKLNIQKGDAIKPLFEALEGVYDYAKLRIALALWEK